MTPNEFIGGLATDTAGDLIGYLQLIMPPVLSVVAIVFGVALMVSLFRWLVTKL